MSEVVYVESYPSDEIAWVHLENPGIRNVRTVEVSDELHKFLVENPIEPTSPLAELVQRMIKHGYSLGAD